MEMSTLTTELFKLTDNFKDKKLLSSKRKNLKKRHFEKKRKRERKKVKSLKLNQFSVYFNLYMITIKLWK